MLKIQNMNILLHKLIRKEVHFFTNPFQLCKQACSRSSGRGARQVVLMSHFVPRSAFYQGPVFSLFLLIKMERLNSGR